MEIYLSIGIILFILFQFFIIKIANNIKKPYEHLDHNTCMDILNETIQREFTLKLKLEYELKDLTMIYNFEKDLSDLVQSVLLSFNDSFIQQLEFYYNKNYIIKYVTRTIEIMLMKFIEEKKIKTK